MTFEDKINLVEKGNFKIKKVMNKSETDIYWALVNCIRGAYIVCPQVAYKTFIDKTTNDETWKVYSSFVADFVLLHKVSKLPLCVIEFHGSGHTGSGFVANEKEREEKYIQVKNNDTLKKKLLEKMKILYIEISSKDICTKNNKIDKEKLITLLNEKLKVN
ncbi:MULTISPECIES: DUF2726 domain-containing protein [unclassified Campylobacter]|uniref:DUF2726 domain-containing protein n=1 Tax=unclassified Campylobacter TaxID=2593542 RepID=UPI0016819542|nr:MULTISPECIES: DUF2726 domain-containing protein [unclassified Campylobacter]